MSTVRLKRLKADYAKLKEYVARHPRIRLIQAEGDPPERYQLEFRLNSIRMVDGELRGVKSHLVEINLPRNYPRTPPQCRMLSPIFHPNIAPHAICVGDHWSSGESLASIVTRIGELISYQVYNVKSPLNGEAARWIEQNLDKLPLDSVSLLVEEVPNGLPRDSEKPAMGTSSSANATVPTQATAPPASGTLDTIVCPTCQKQFRFRVEFAGRQVRCNQCSTVFELPLQPPSDMS